jgi:hypothetical protein
MAFEGSVLNAGAPENDLAARVQALNVQLRDAHPLDILRAAAAEYGGHIALVSSFGAESAVLLHLEAQVDPSTPVLFLDTGMLFGQTLDYRRSLAKQLGQGGAGRLRPGTQSARPSPGGLRLSLGGLLALHPAGGRRSGRARGPLGGLGKDRVRHPRHPCRAAARRDRRGYLNPPLTFRSIAKV